MNRRKFIRLTTRGVAATLLAGGVYSAAEAKCLQVTRIELPVPNLPSAFRGKTVAFLSDIHHSLVVPRSYVDAAVEMTNMLLPDIVVLGGDYVTSGLKYRWLEGEKYIEPCFDSLRELKSKMGNFAVTGNHDTHAGLGKVNAVMKAAGFWSIDNTGEWLSLGNDRLRLCGVADLRTQVFDVRKALGDAKNSDAVILVSHNPDMAERGLVDDRVGVMLSGHTHGGQVVLPFIGAPVVGLCSDYKQKYRYGMVQGPRCRVFVTSGVGTLPPAFRLNCPPEIVLATLVAPT